MSFKLKIAKPAASAGSSTYPDPIKDSGYPNLFGANASPQAGNSWVYPSQFGLTGGDTATAGTTQIVCNVKIGSNSADSAGFIVRQRGRSTYLVQDSSGNQGVCQLVNANVGALTANTMSVQATYANNDTFLVQAIKDKIVIDFNGIAYLITPDAGARSTTPPAGASYASGGVVTLAAN